jgi:DNA-binding NarL/FixJ family response regulator
VKILVVDDHALIREALRGVLVELRSDATILEARDARQAARLAEEHADLALVLLDLNLPDRDGFELLAELRERLPATSVVVLSAFNDRDNVEKALGLGALGFIPKTATRELMKSALGLVFAGGVYIPPDILPAQQPFARRAVSTLGLSERQLEVLALMMHGKSNKLICRALDLAEPTVKNHVTAVLKALNASNRTEAVVAAGALRWDVARPAAR